MRRTVVAMIVVSALLASCAASAPVVGQMQRSDETFRGNITGSGYSGGSGELTMLSNHQAECRGTFTYISRRRGDGVLNCNDGRTGPFHIAAAGTTGNGYGDLDGQRFTFSIGAR